MSTYVDLDLISNADLLKAFQQEDLSKTRAWLIKKGATDEIAALRSSLDGYKATLAQRDDNLLRTDPCTVVGIFEDEVELRNYDGVELRNESAHYMMPKIFFHEDLLFLNTRLYRDTMERADKTRYFRFRARNPV